VVGVELDSVDRPVPLRDRRAELGQAAERRVTVRSRAIRRLGERVDDVLRRPGLRVAAPEIEDIAGRRDARQQRAEVLLGQAFEPAWPLPPQWYVKFTIPAMRAL
jgi:hypothetical protein